jgi:hypothetical protein
MGVFQQPVRIRAIESSGFLERAMEIEPISEVWESTKPFVGRLSHRSCGQGVGEGVAKRHGQDGSFGALQPPATIGGRPAVKNPPVSKPKWHVVMRSPLEDGSMSKLTSVASAFVT